LGIAEKNFAGRERFARGEPSLQAQASPLSRRRALSVHREPLDYPAAQFRRR